MNRCKLPSFEEATANLRSFLTIQGFNSDIVWICREAVLVQWPKLYVRTPLQNESLLVERIYNEGVRRGLGVELQVFCFVGGCPCCHIWIPQDETDANYRMLVGLKLCIREPNVRETLVPVKNGFVWYWLNYFRFENRSRSWADDIPSRTLSFDDKIGSSA